MLAIVTLPDSAVRYALGLTWEHEPVKPKATALRERARRLGRFGVVRHTATNVYQAGYGDLPPGTKGPGRVRALASLAAEHYQSPWMGLFRLTDEISWLVAVRDGEIVPGGDQFGPHDALIVARNALRAQENWHDQDGSVADLVEIAGLAAPEQGLRDLQATVPAAFWISAGVIGFAALATTGGFVWVHQREEKQLADLQAQQQMLAAAHRAQREAEAAIPPWTKLPAPSALFAGCAGAWHDQQQVRKGWMLSDWSCSQQGASMALSVNWTRTGGTALDAPGVLLDPDNSKESLTRDAALAPSSAPAALADAARRAILSFSQTRSVPLVLDPPPKPDPKDAKRNPEDAPPWQTRGATFTLDAPPWTLYGPDFDATPGLRIDSVAFDATKRTWTVSGTLYAWTRAPKIAPAARSLPVPGGART